MDADNDTERDPSTARQCTIRRVMLVIAALAPLLALTRYPYAFGLARPVALIAVFVTLSVRGRRYDLVAWLIIAYPALPLLTLDLHWALIKQKLASRSTPLFGGLIGPSDVGGFLCLIVYVGCVSVLAGRLKANGQSEDARDLRRAARRVVFLMPPVWVALFIFALWDPLGMLGYFIR